MSARNRLAGLVFVVIVIAGLAVLLRPSCEGSPEPECEYSTDCPSDYDSCTVTACDEGICKNLEFESPEGSSCIRCNTTTDCLPYEERMRKQSDWHLCKMLHCNNSGDRQIGRCAWVVTRDSQHTEACRKTCNDGNACTVDRYDHVRGSYGWDCTHEALPNGTPCHDARHPGSHDPEDNPLWTCVAGACINPASGSRPPHIVRPPAAEPHPDYPGNLH